MADAFTQDILRRVKGVVLGSFQQQSPVMITTGHKESAGGSPGISLGSLANGVWPTANMGYIIPFQVHQNSIWRKMFIFNGGTLSGNVSAGIYDENYILQASLSTAHAGLNTIQELDITDKNLPPGRYYLAMSMDNNSAIIQGYAIPAAYGRMLGISQMASSYPLPSTFVPAAMAGTFVPCVGLSQRTLV